MDKLRRSRTGSVLEFAGLILVAVGLAFALQAWIVKPYEIPSGSMEPTLSVGQRILVDRIGLSFTSPKLGDVMVFHPPVDDSSCSGPPRGQTVSEVGQACDAVGRAESGLAFVKRVVGLPGDRLTILNGQVIDNGRREPHRDAVACAGGNAACDFPRTIVVPRGDYYMMGDNRPDSEDSRFWGPVPKRWLIGYVFFSFWPLHRIGFL